jgi:hypothetical protein
MRAVQVSVQFMQDYPVLWMFGDVLIDVGDPARFEEVADLPVQISRDAVTVT